MFSYHPDRVNIGKCSLYSQGWRTYETSLRSLTSCMIALVTSPIVFRDGIRRKSHFLRADWIGLDFDDGVGMADMLATFAGYIHVCGPTKSHQRQKGDSPPCDRFRLWLKTRHTITNLYEYEATARHFVSTYGADPAGVDGARMFGPCTAIVSAARTGKTVDVVLPRKVDYKPHQRTYNGKIPPWVQDWLNGTGVDFGTKTGGNFHIFKAALWLGKNGWRENDIVSLVMSSALVGSGEHAISQSVVLKSVRSGMEASKRPDKNWR